MTGERTMALREIAFCEAILAKAGLNVLSDTFRSVAEIRTWDHYPPGDVFDPASGSQWYYHSHEPGDADAEHGHFHCFVRPHGTDGPVHHLVAVGVDAHGRLLRLFTVNQWVVGDDWLDAGASIQLLPRFDMQMPNPSYLVNRWLSAVVRAYSDDIAALLVKRDQVLNERAADALPLNDRSLEVLSQHALVE